MTPIRALLLACSASDDAIRLPARRELCSRAAAGEAAAIDGVAGLYWHRVYAALLARGVPHAHAEDLTQEACLRVARRCQAGMDELTMPAFAVTIAWNLWQDRLRKDKPLKFSSGTPDDPTPDLPVLPTGGGELEEERVRREFERLIGEQKPRTQEMVRRTFAGEQPPEAIAAELGTTPHALKQVVWRFRVELRERLERLGFDVPGPRGSR